MTFIPWPEIEGFHNIRKFTAASAHPEILNGQSVVNYRCKVKLHGTNAAVQLHDKGEIVCQSRESILTPEKDNAGFARWAMTNKEKWFGAVDKAYVAGLPGIIIFGEWCGPGIQKGVAVASLPKKCFAVFAARPMDDSGKLIVEPEELRDLVKGIPDVYVLDWYTRTVAYGSDTRVYAQVNVDWNASAEELTKITETINGWVAEVEASDPWTKEVFGIEGTGEGLVFYPRSPEHLTYTDFSNLVFKAKGEKHKNIATAKPAQVDASTAASMDAFVTMVLTEARLEQGATKVALTPGSYDQQQTGKFVSWILGDVEKEAQDELTASNLDWKQVQKPLQNKARQWYLEKAKL
jgi:RNA ligase-like protein